MRDNGRGITDERETAGVVMGRARRVRVDVDGGNAARWAGETVRVRAIGARADEQHDIRRRKVGVRVFSCAVCSDRAERPGTGIAERALAMNGGGDGNARALR